MRVAAISTGLFVQNRQRLTALLPAGSLAIVNNHDEMPESADSNFPLRPNSDLFYLTGIAQEETVLLLFPDSLDPKGREILFLRETSELLETWEGRKLTKEAARKASGIERIEWLSALPTLLRMAMCEAEHVYLNSNEHSRAVVAVETREMRFARELIGRYPLHDYRRLAPLLHGLRLVKSEGEIRLLRRACEITADGFARVARFLKPGVTEMDVEAEYAHEFTRQGGGFAYPPIIATGENACALHYSQNDARCRAGELLLLDVASSYAHYHSDLTRVLPVSGRFTRRQRQVYEAVLRVFRQCAALLRPGLLPRDWRKAADEFTEKELVDLKLLKMSDLRRQGEEKTALRKYFMHGVGHPIGLDVHDVGAMTQPMQPGWVMTCEPGIYLREEKMGIRLENVLMVTDGEPLDLMAGIPIEPEEVEELMRKPA